MVDPDIEFDDKTRYQKIIFYQNFCHELTISIRTVCGNPGLREYEKVNYLRGINEIMQLAHSRLKNLLEAEYKIIDESIWNRINRILKKGEGLESYITFAVESAELVSEASSHLTIFIDDYD